MMATREVVELYGQPVTGFDLRLFIRPEAATDGALLVALGEHVMRTLILPRCRLTGLWTKRAQLDAKMNVGEFTDARWAAAVPKLRAGTYHVVELIAEDPDRGNHRIMVGAQVNPPKELQGYPVPVVGTVDVHCSLSYIRELAGSPKGAEALLDLGRMAWNGTEGAAYGFGNLAYSPKLVPFNPSGPQDPNYVPPWEQPRGAPDVRPHPIPIAYVGLNVDTNLEDAYCAGRGIKGAFWANFLTRDHVERAGGERSLREGLAGCRIEPMRDGGLLIVATDSPVPDDTPENRERFLNLHRRLQPVFIPRSGTPERRQALLGYFYRERTSIVP